MVRELIFPAGDPTLDQAGRLLAPRLSKDSHCSSSTSGCINWNVSGVFIPPPSIDRLFQITGASKAVRLLRCWGLVGMAIRLRGHSRPPCAELSDRPTLPRTGFKTSFDPLRISDLEGPDGGFEIACKEMLRGPLFF